MTLQALLFDEETFGLRVLDQTLLPGRLEYVDIKGASDGFNSIKSMMVRGAPCIAAVACLSLICELNNSANFINSTQTLVVWLTGKGDYLVSARPTAVNLKQALDKLVNFCGVRMDLRIDEAKRQLSEFCLQAIRKGREANIRLGDLGASELSKITNWEGANERVSILTHCNTGALATVGHGTALGVIRSLHSMGKLEHAYCTETRPYNQGSRLTAWELVTERIPATLIADSMVAYLMATRKIHAVVVGADRVAANGDTANKIGTLQIAVSAKHYGVPFYVAAPTQSIDLATRDARAIVIEQRPADELRKIGPIQLAPDGVEVWNPSFDVTPADLISGIITEMGVCKPEELVEFLENLTDKSEDVLF